jgi:tetratricopeptide (TPR) repeat protein
MRELAAACEKVAAVQGGVALSDNGRILSTSNLGDMPGTLESLRKALAIRERVLAMEPNSKKVRQELSSCYARTGFLYMFNGPPDKAVEYLGKGTSLMEALLAADPASKDLQYQLWDLYMGLAKSLGSPSVPNLGNTKAAMEYMNKAQSVGDRFASDQPTSPESQQVLGSLYNAYGQMFRGAGQQQEALDSFKKVVAIDEELVKSDP